MTIPSTPIPTPNLGLSPPDHPTTPTAPLAQGRRLLKERDWNAINGDSGDSTGTEVLSRARVFEGGPGTPRRAVTPEAAEATANPGFLGIWRREMTDKNSVPFATVESDPLFVNPDRKKGTIMPRARSAQDVPDLAHKPNLVSGNAQVPVVAMGSAAVANTFEGEAVLLDCDSMQLLSAVFSWPVSCQHRTALAAGCYGVIQQLVVLAQTPCLMNAHCRQPEAASSSLPPTVLAVVQMAHHHILINHKHLSAH